MMPRFFNRTAQVNASPAPSGLGALGRAMSAAPNLMPLPPSNMGSVGTFPIQELQSTMPVNNPVYSGPSSSTSPGFNMPSTNDMPLGGINPKQFLGGIDPYFNPITGAFTQPPRPGSVNMSSGTVNPKQFLGGIDPYFNPITGAFTQPPRPTPPVTPRPVPVQTPGLGLLSTLFRRGRR